MSGGTAVLAVRVGPVSAALRPAVLARHVLLAVAGFGLFCLAVGRGDYPVSPAQVLEVLAGGGTGAERFVVVELRLPRAVLGILVGAALGIAGALTQSTLRNPLAGPDILGVTAGASLGAVALLAFGGAGAGASLGTPAAALAGGLITAVAVYLLGWRAGVDRLRLVLIGIGINAMLLALVNWLLVRAAITDVGTALRWLSGSLALSDWSEIRPLAVGFVVATGLALWSVPTSAVLRLGDDPARSLGVRLHSRQAVILFAAVLLASFATAAAGPIAFVALAAPQIARRGYRVAGEPVVGSALVGVILVLGSDIVAQTMFPVEFPVGIVTSAFGAIFLLWFLVRANRAGSG